MVTHAHGALNRGSSGTVAGMQGVAEQGQPRILYTYRTQRDIKQHVTGCDADIGGKSSVHLDLGQDGRARFWGDMRLEVPRGKEDTLRSGYAGFRSRVRHQNMFFPSLLQRLLYRYGRHYSGTLQTTSRFTTTLLCESVQQENEGCGPHIS